MDVVALSIGLIVLFGYVELFMDRLPKEVPVEPEYVAPENRAKRNRVAKTLFGYSE